MKHLDHDLVNMLCYARMNGTQSGRYSFEKMEKDVKKILDDKRKEE